MNERYLIELSLSLALLTFTFYHLVKRYKKPSTIIINDVAIWTTGLVFGLSPFIFIYSGGSFIEANINDVILSYLGIFLFIFGLNIVTKFNFIFHKPNNKENYFSSLKRIVNAISSKEVFFFYLLFFIVRMYIAFEYNVFVSGSATEKKILNLPYIVVLLRGIIDLFLYPSLFWSITILLIRKKFLLLPSLIILIEFLISFFQGRRPILFLFFATVFVFVVLGYRIDKRSLILLIITLYITISFIFPNFLTFRDYYSYSQNKTNIIDDITYNLDLTFSTNRDSYKHLDNIKNRSYINDWNISIMKKSGIYDGLNGNVLFLSATWVIPKFFFQNKYLIMSPEFLVNAYSNNYSTDSPENLPGYGFADFGLLGGFLYGVIFGYILIFIENLALKTQNNLRYFSLLLMSSSIFIVFSVEQSLISVFSMLRSSFIILIIFILFKFFNVIKSPKKL